MDTDMGMDMEKISKIGFITVLALSMVGCAPKGVQVTKENALVICLDEACIPKDKIENEEVKQKNGFIVEFDYKQKHYTFKVSEGGILQSRKVEDAEGSQTKEELKKEEEVKEPEITQKEKDAIAASILNSGLVESDVENITSKINADNTITVTFRIKGMEGKIITTCDQTGAPISSRNE